VPRRDRDPRPEIEVIGGAPASESLQDVSVGGRGGGERRRRLGRWRNLGVGLVVVVGLVALFTSDGADEGEASSSSTSAPRRSTTTTQPTTSTTYVAAGPLTSASTGGALLVLANQSRRWHVLELDTGELRVFQLPDSANVDAFGSFVPVRGGVVVTDGTGTMFVPVVPGGRPRTLAKDANVAYSAGRDDRVWLTSFETLQGAVSDDLRLVDLQGKVLARRRGAFMGWSTATEIGPVFSDGGRTFVLDERGPRSLGVGDVVATSATAAVVRSCDDQVRCAIALVDARTGARRELGSLSSATADIDQSWFVVTPDGDTVELTNPTPSTEVTWVGPDGALVAQGELTFGGESPPEGFGFQGDPAFLPGRQGFAMTAGDGRVYLARIVGRTFETEPLPLPSLRVDRVAVVRP
jgi:hypothetical protein